MPSNDGHYRGGEDENPPPWNVSGEYSRFLGGLMLRLSAPRECRRSSSIGRAAARWGAPLPPILPSCSPMKGRATHHPFFGIYIIYSDVGLIRHPRSRPLTLGRDFSWMNMAAGHVCACRWVYVSTISVSLSLCLHKHRGGQDDFCMWPNIPRLGIWVSGNKNFCTVEISWLRPIGNDDRASPLQPRVQDVSEAKNVGRTTLKMASS